MKRILIKITRKQLRENRSFLHGITESFTGWKCNHNLNKKLRASKNTVLFSKIKKVSDFY